MRCDIVIPVWNMKALTEQCVNSIIRSTKFPYRLILVDNASDEETRRYLEGLTHRGGVDARLIRNEENLGNSKAANQGMRASDAEYVCVLDNDTIVTDGWLAEMVGVAGKDERIGVVNPVSNFGAKKPSGKTWEEVARAARARNKKEFGDYVETAAAIGCCFLIKRAVIEKIGYWPEGYGPGYFEDTEYSVRAVRNGYKIAIAQGAYVVHLEHSSFKKTGRFDELFKKNQKLFYEQFGTAKRSLYILTGKNSFGIDRNAYEKAQNRHWIWVFARRGLPLALPRHAYIAQFRLHKAFFQLNCIARILARKKKFDEIFCDLPSLNRKLELLKGLHRAEVRKA